MPTPWVHPLLAQAERSTGSIVVWSLVLIFTIVAMFVVLALYRKWMSSDDTPTSGPAFTLSDLRKLHKDGKMTTEEYEKAKTAIVGSLKTAATPAKPTDGPPRRPQPPITQDPDGAA